MLGQGADAQLHGAQLVKVRDERRRRDTDEARREPALRYEGLGGADGDRAHGPGDLYVLGEVEVMCVGPAGRLRDRRHCSGRAGLRSPPPPDARRGAGRARPRCLRPGRSRSGAPSRAPARPPRRRRRRRRPAAPGNCRIRLAILRSMRRSCRRPESIRDAYGPPEKGRILPGMRPGRQRPRQGRGTPLPGLKKAPAGAC